MRGSIRASVALKDIKALVGLGDPFSITEPT